MGTETIRATRARVISAQQEKRKVTVDAKPEVGTPQLSQKKNITITKRGRGRPPGISKPFVTALPAPPKHESFNPTEFFGYIRSIPEDKLNRVLLSFYRYHPVCDVTEGGKVQRDKCIGKIAGESHPFRDDNWEKQILHLYGSGNYGCFLNESAPNGEPGSKTVMTCRRIDTVWDPDSYPPVLDPKTLVESFPGNQAYVQWLRQKGVQLPSEVDKEKEEMEMQIGETISKLTDTVIAQANRINTPVPSVPARESLGEKLTYDAAKAAIDLTTERAKQLGESSDKASSPMDTVNAIVNVAERITGAAKGGDDGVTKLLAQMQADSARRAEAAEKRANDLIEMLLKRNDTPAAQPKSFLEQLKEMAEMKSLMKEAFGGGDDEEGGGRQSIPEMLVASAPALLQHGVTMWGQFNQSMALMARMKELEVAKANGQSAPPPSFPIPPHSPQQAQPQQANGNNGNNGNNGSPGEQPKGEVNPATGQPYTQQELEARHAELVKFQQYHGFIAEIAQPIVTHLNDPGEIIDGERVKKDGYDFAQWFIAGRGRLTYDQIKSICPPDVLFGAIKSYVPLWSIIGGAEDKVKEFIGEFLTLDEMEAEENKEEIEDAITVKAGV